MLAPDEMAACHQHDDLDDLDMRRIAGRVLVQRYRKIDSTRIDSILLDAHARTTESSVTTVPTAHATNDAGSYRWANSFAVIITALGGFATRLALAKMLLAEGFEVPPEAIELAQRLVIVPWPVLLP